MKEALQHYSEDAIVLFVKQGKSRWKGNVT